MAITRSEVSPAMSASMRKYSMKKFFSFLGVLVLIVVFVGAGYWVYSGSGLLVPRPDGKKWQAVFLANGQVYFGKLSGINRTYVTLSDIYYLQVSQPLQQPAEGAPQQQPNINLIKLGDELHGPENTMYIERSKVLFWENLRNDGRVVQAISQAKK